MKHENLVLSNKLIKVRLQILYRGNLIEPNLENGRAMILLVVGTLHQSDSLSSTTQDISQMVSLPVIHREQTGKCVSLW